MAGNEDLTVRPASQEDHLGVMTVLDSSMLEVNAETVERRIDADRVLVAEVGDRVLGALVAVPRADPDGERRGAHVEAIAVRRRRRDQGIGTELVETAAEQWGWLTVTFDPTVRRFYERLGFAIEDEGERCRGTFPPDAEGVT